MRNLITIYVEALLDFQQLAGSGKELMDKGAFGSIGGKKARPKPPLRQNTSNKLFTGALGSSLFIYGRGTSRAR